MVEKPAKVDEQQWTAWKTLPMLFRGKIPVMMDGGIRRGKDIFKALARGATAVGIGSPYLWGLASFGQPGVEMVLKMLKAELELAMKQTGVRSLAEISKTNIVD